MRNSGGREGRNAPPSLTPANRTHRFHSSLVRILRNTAGPRSRDRDHPAAFCPHSERRIRCASSLSVTFEPTRQVPATVFPGGPRTHTPRQPAVGEAVVEFLDVRQRAHGHMVLWVATSQIQCGILSRAVCCAAATLSPPGG